MIQGVMTLYCSLMSHSGQSNEPIIFMFIMPYGFVIFLRNVENSCRDIVLTQMIRI
jgi:hypothetical protein